MFNFEVRFIWAARWNLIKCLYLLTRYLQFILLGALLYQSMLSSHPSFPKVPRSEFSRCIEPYTPDKLHSIGKSNHRYLLYLLSNILIVNVSPSYVRGLHGPRRTQVQYPEFFLSFSGADR